jgi:glutamate-1-semialdehyde 2,1-aminomutase
MILDRGRLGALLADEERRFREAHPRSLALYERARRSLLGGVPMHWMVRWAGGFPLFVEGGEGPVSPTWTATAISTFAWATPAR